MASKSAGNDNMTRLGMAIIDELTQVLRDILSGHIPHSNIYNVVNSSTIRLRPEQLSLVANASTSGYRNFDITLLYTLIRNLCTAIAPPTRGWGNAHHPRPGDITLGNDIERIRLIRNEVYGHIPSTFISDVEFQRYWSVITEICKRMQQRLGGNYVNELLSFENCPIDAQLEQKYLKQLEVEKELQHKMEEMTTSVKTDIQEIKSEIKSQIQDLKVYLQEPQRTSAEMTRACAKVSAVTSPRKQENLQLIFEMTCDTLNTVVDEINENTTKDQFFDVLEEILVLGKCDSNYDMSEGIVMLLSKIKAKVKWYSRINEIQGHLILLRFTQITTQLMMMYKVRIEASKGSLILKFQFQYNRLLQKYLTDVRNGVFKDLLQEIMLSPLVLSMFGFERNEVELQVNIFTEDSIQEMISSYHSVITCYRNWKEERLSVLEQLNGIKEMIQKEDKQIDQSKILSFIGGTMAAVGTVALPFTVGLSSGLAITGGILATSGGLKNTKIKRVVTEFYNKTCLILQKHLVICKELGKLIKWLLHTSKIIKSLLKKQALKMDMIISEAVRKSSVLAFLLESCDVENVIQALHVARFLDKIVISYSKSRTEEEKLSPSCFGVYGVDTGIKNIEARLTKMGNSTFIPSCKDCVEEFDKIIGMLRKELLHIEGLDEFSHDELFKDDKAESGKPYDEIARKLRNIGDEIRQTSPQK